MTREEAINILEEIKIVDDGIATYIRGFYKAIDMAIEALSAQNEKLTREETTRSQRRE